MANHHDSFFKAVFSRPAEAAGVLKAVLPAQLVAQLDLSTAKQIKDTFVDQRLSWRYSDLLYAVRLLGRETLVYVLWEAQSQEDPLMPLRLLIYMGRIWDDWLRNEEARRKKVRDHRAIDRVPPILPVVLHQGPKRWEAPTGFCEVIDLPADLLEAVREHLPSFRFVLDDLSLEDDHALRCRESGPLGKLALILMRHARDQREALLALLRTVADLIGALETRDDRVLAFSYILEIVEAGPEEVRRALGPLAGPETEEDVVTAAEKLREEGKAEGEIKRSREILLRQLRLKAGVELPQEVEQRVQAATLVDLDGWLERVVTASSVDDVFAEESSE